MTKEKKPNIVIFTNKEAGQPVKKQDGSFVVNAQGDSFNQSDFTGKIELPEGLPAGNYEVAIYKSTAKSGLEYLRGNIRPAWVKKEGEQDEKKFNGKEFVKKAQNAHNSAKGNGYVPQSNHVEEELSDEIPF